MYVRISDEMENVEVKVCDLVDIKGFGYERGTYIIMEEPNGYILRNLINCQGATGYFKTIKALMDSICDQTYVHYSQEQYRLVLERKS